MNNIQDKIAKLLALAESPNENEAKLALLKARKLMAKHKLSEKDIEITSKRNVKKQMLDISFTSMTDVWCEQLGYTIASNYCCQSFISQYYHGKRLYVGFIRLEDDFDVCKKVFMFAYNFIINRCNEIKSEYRNIKTSREIRNLCNYYGRGFVIGLMDMFEKQNQTEETGLVLVIPKEVKDITDTMETNQKSYLNISAESLGALNLESQGYTDGLNFKPNYSIE